MSLRLALCTSTMPVGQGGGQRVWAVRKILGSVVGSALILRLETMVPSGQRAWAAYFRLSSTRRTNGATPLRGCPGWAAWESWAWQRWSTTLTGGQPVHRRPGAGCLLVGRGQLHNGAETRPPRAPEHATCCESAPFGVRPLASYVTTSDNNRRFCGPSSASYTATTCNEKRAA